MTASDLYIRVRDKEGRLYSDNMVRNLPDVPLDHPLRAEWCARAASMRRLMDHIRRLPPHPARLLDVGCGNGWLSHHLCALRGLSVWGVDRAGPELTQAAGIFGAGNLMFLEADVFQPPVPQSSFDVIVMASVIQYFPDLPRLIQSLQLLLRPGGEIHVIDSPLYDAAGLAAAQKRTEAYYAALGFPDMSAHYFHHTYAELRPFAPIYLHRPDSLPARVSRRIGRPQSPFPWVLIRSPLKFVV